MGSLRGLFPCSWRRYLVDLCRMCVDRMKECWVPVLPLLHHCMELAPQRKGLVLQPEDTWAALEGIPFSEYREKIPDGYVSGPHSCTSVSE